MAIKGGQQGACGDGTVEYLGGSGDGVYGKVHMIKLQRAAQVHVHPHLSACLTGAVSISSVGCTNVPILI